MAELVHKTWERSPKEFQALKCIQTGLFIFTYLIFLQLRIRKKTWSSF